VPDDQLDVSFDSEEHPYEEHPYGVDMTSDDLGLPHPIDPLPDDYAHGELHAELGYGGHVDPNVPDDSADG
jgi:hypothetical protein